jgi:hypothetical protein
MPFTETEWHRGGGFGVILLARVAGGVEINDVGQLSSLRKYWPCLTRRAFYLVPSPVLQAN